jgi:hypothetical protein
LVDLLRPQKVQIVLPERKAPGMNFSVSRKRAVLFKDIVSQADVCVEIVGEFERKGMRRQGGYQDTIVSMLKRRPASLQELSLLTGVKEKRLKEELRSLAGEVNIREYKGYYHIKP